MEKFVERKARAGELDKIVEVANAAFEPVRFLGYDFVKTMPKIYASKKDCSDIHHVCEFGGKMVAVCGNWIRKIQIGKKSYPFSFVGTVATRQEFQGKGCMGILMRATEQECLEKGIVFSALVGDKEMYAHFGFEQAGYFCVFEFDKSFVGENSDNIEIRELKTNGADACNKMYADAQIFNLRSKNTFLECVGDFRAKVFMICENGAQIGYFVLKKGEVVEFYSKNLNLITQIVSKIISCLGVEQIRFVVNPLHVELCEKLGEIASVSQIQEEIQFKVFDWKKFVEMLFETNKTFRTFEDAQECFCVDGKRLFVEVKDNQISVEETKQQGECLPNFSSKEFVRFVFGCSSGSQTQSKIFPMLFGFDVCDMF